MAKLSRTVKEIIKTVLFFAVIALVLFVYVIYPLNSAKTLMARADIDTYNPDSLAVNDPAAYQSAGLAADTFMFEADGLTNLACLKVPPGDDSLAEAQGTVFLLHKDGSDRDSLISLATALHQAGFLVIAYDQRASGRTSGKYRGDGSHEANDIQALISHLEIRGQIAHPLYLVGYELGADAALLAADEEKRIDGVVAVTPYLTTPRFQDALRARYEGYWFPFYRTIMWWWYEMRSSYATLYRRIEDIQAVSCPTLIFVPADRTDSEEVLKISELSPPEMLQVAPVPADDSALIDRIVSFVAALPTR